MVENPTLSEAEFLDASKQHPMKYATQLASGSSSFLVGPQFYFSFLSALKTGASITAGIFLIVAVIATLASGDHWRTFFRVLFELPGALLWVGAVILGVFVAMEKGGEKATWLESWKASDLSLADGHQSISRSEAFFDLSLSSIALLWIFNIIHLNYNTTFSKSITLVVRWITPSITWITPSWVISPPWWVVYSSLMCS